MTDLQSTSSTGAETPIGEAALAAFQAGLRGELLRSGDDGYDED